MRRVLVGFAAGGMYFESRRHSDPGRRRNRSDSRTQDNPWHNFQVICPPKNGERTARAKKATAAEAVPAVFQSISVGTSGGIWLYTYLAAICDACV